MFDKDLIAGAGVQAAKQRFDSVRVKRKVPYSFEELFELFKVDSIPFSEIAGRAGVKQQAVQQLYYRYFKDLFSGRSGVDRIKSTTPKRHAAKVEEAKRAFDDVPLLNLMAREARAAGCSVEAVPASAGPGTIYRARLRIDGHVCSVHHLTKKQKPSPDNKQWSIRMRVATSTLAEVKFLIVRTAVKGLPMHTFVVPVSTLAQTHKTSSMRRAVNVWLPAKKLPGLNNRLDWWAHEDAWHLLRSPSSLQVPT